MQQLIDPMNKMVEQMAQTVAPVKTTAWGGRHGSLALVLDDADYSSITKTCVTSTKLVTQPDAINKGIMTTSSHLKILTFQEEMKKLQKDCLRRIAPAATMVDKFVETTQNTNKSQLLPSNYSTF